jgi:FkbM family methyltransferase
MFEPWEGVVEQGWTVNWLGVRTRLEMQGGVRGVERPSTIRTEPPGASEDLLEWVDVLESVAESGASFTMLELGAGWGRWLVNAAAAARRLDPERALRLVGVEAEPTHFRWLVRHFRDNGLEPREHMLVRAAVAARDGSVKFQRGDAADWYGQSIERDDPAAKLAGPVSRVLRWGRNAAANRLALAPDSRRVRRTRAVSLRTLLAPLDHVDLIDADIQGVEADVFEAAADAIDAKVRRVHVGTHGPEIEERLRALFGGLGWDCRFDYAAGTRAPTEWGPVDFEDGVQSWLNPALPPRE